MGIPCGRAAGQQDKGKESPAKEDKKMHKNIEELEKFGKVAQKFNFKSRKKANLEKELGVVLVSPSKIAKNESIQQNPAARAEDGAQSSNPDRDQNEQGE